MNKEHIAYAFLATALILLAHHYFKHTELPMPNRLFETKDVSNHETWILVCVTVFFTLMVLC
jgi:hypothetical protein